MTATSLHHDIDQLKSKSQTYILYLQVRNSRLQDMSDLPSGLDGVRHLVLDDTGIDFETLRQSSEILLNLKSLRLYNEHYTEIPEDFFQGMHELTSLELNDIGIAAISEDAFNYLEDSLKELRLRGNRLRSIPIAISSLRHLEIVDLANNEIHTVADDLRYKLESSLKSLKKLEMNRINCSCGFEKTAFVTWIRSHAIKGVKCYEPAYLYAKEVSITPKEDFCDAGSAAKSGPTFAIFSTILTIILSKVYI
ncbi:aspartate-tRNA ligase: cytoplasmic-like protein [Leptotrombidium deliense]|uniref:Aspartate-tRNA ligase: cytoplasmic-like protein n=1 Tax=Leptotrombidium deliense TaxID=299467 RepID=A0A443SCM7_9ACAR|nr:aspartate-tRNA ligase: cytoplasmic-like protein [Leptotrombidium deliense]